MCAMYSSHVLGADRSRMDLVVCKWEKIYDFISIFGFSAFPTPVGLLLFSSSSRFQSPSPVWTVIPHFSVLNYCFISHPLLFIFGLRRYSMLFGRLFLTVTCQTQIACTLSGTDPISPVIGWQRTKWRALKDIVDQKIIGKFCKVSLKR